MRQTIFTTMAAAVVLGGFAILHGGLDVQPAMACNGAHCVAVPLPEPTPQLAVTVHHADEAGDQGGPVKMCNDPSCQDDFDGAEKMCSSRDCQDDLDGAVKMCNGNNC